MNIAISESHSYNARGSLTWKAENGDTTFYTYDLMGNLTSVVLPNGDLIEYLVDGQNRRVGKKLNGVVQKQWLYQDQLNPVAELDGEGNLVAWFAYGEKGHVPSFMYTMSGGIYRFITDHLGSVRLLVDCGTGEIVQQISYDEFGNVLSNTNPDFQPFAYAGGLYDSQTKLVRFGARDYDARVGRWACKEPLKFIDGNNVFLYCQNNPIHYYDANGLWTVQIGVSGTAGAGEGVTAGAGIVIGYSDDSGFQVGGYTTYGGGAHYGVSAGLAVDITLSNNSNIDQLDGVALTIGGSGFGPGLEANFVCDNLGESSVTISPGVGVGAEGHSYATKTDIYNWTDWMNSVSQGMNQAVTNIVNTINGTYTQVGPR